MWDLQPSKGLGLGMFRVDKEGIYSVIRQRRIFTQSLTDILDGQRLK